MPKGLKIKKRKEVGIPYAEMNEEDGTLICPVCASIISADPTVHFQDSKAVGLAYGVHYTHEHSDEEAA